MGKTGAIAWVDDGHSLQVAGRAFGVTIQPLIGKAVDEQGMLLLLADADADHVFIEHAQGMPKQGRSSIFNYGMHYGMWRMAMAARAIPYTIVTPGKWKRAMGVTKDKQSSILMAQRLFPGVDLRPTQKCTKLSDGMAEALLIAGHGRRVLAGG